MYKTKNIHKYNMQEDKTLFNKHQHRDGFENSNYLIVTCTEPTFPSNDDFIYVIYP